MSDALRIAHLDVAYTVRGRERTVLDDLSFRIPGGGAYGLVGESGCGKSTAAFAAVRYLARNGRIRGGTVAIDGTDVTALSPAELRGLRKSKVAMVYQDPGRALNPSLRIGRQMTEVFAGLPAAAARERALEMLARVQVAGPERVFQSYPHELSGGLQQRVVIAMALSIDPALLILDEPTTGLDATVEAAILDLLAELRAEFATAILLISHSLPAIARMCDTVGVLYAGRLVEEGPVRTVFADPRHPYTAGLLACAPVDGRRKDQGALDSIPGFPPAPGTILAGCIYADRCPLVQDRCRVEAPPLTGLGGRSTRCHFPERVPGMPRAANEWEAYPGAGRGPATNAPILDPGLRRGTPLLQVRDLSKTFAVAGKPLYAVRDVSLDLCAGETLGLVGESGSGKSTLAKLLLGLAAPDAGSRIALDGEPLPARARRRRRDQLKALQMVFQNPGLALNRAHSVRRLIGRALRLTGASDPERRLRALAERVRLGAHHLDEKPARLSGGLKQRVGIARAFAGEPRIVLCDEPTSALDVSVQSAILNLLVDLQAEDRVAYLFISHDLGVVNYIADRVAVLYLGRLMEIGPTRQVLAAPHHPYTEALASASLALGGGARRVPLEGEIPSPTAPPSGCVFHTRCPRKIGPVCEEHEPELIDAGDGHAIRCHIPADELRRMQASPPVAPDPETIDPSPSA